MYKRHRKKGIYCAECTICDKLVAGYWTGGTQVEILKKVYQETKDEFSIRLLAGEAGLKNIVRWVYMMEDIQNYTFVKESELVITTGLIANEEEKLLQLIQKLLDQKACGLLISMGKYILEVPKAVIDFCEEQEFPLMGMPWEISIANVSRAFYERILRDDLVRKDLRSAMIGIIENESDTEKYLEIFREYGYEWNGEYVCVAAAFEDKEKNQDTFFGEIEIFCRNILNSYRRTYMLFHYCNRMIIVLHSDSRQQVTGMLHTLREKLCFHMRGEKMYFGVGNPFTDPENLGKAFRQASAALEVAEKENTDLKYFGDTGIYQILYSVKDPELLCSFGKEILWPVMAYDKEHDSDFLETLRLYITYNSNVQRVAEESCMHRNTVNYRIRKIKDMLDNALEDMNDYFPLQMAFYILELYPEFQIEQGGTSYEEKP